MDVVLVGSKVEIDGYTENLFNTLTKIGIVVKPFYIYNLFDFIRKLPMIRKPDVVHFNFYISIVGYFFAPLLSLIYLYFKVQNIKIITVFHTVWSVSQIEEMFHTKHLFLKILVKPLFKSYWSNSIHFLSVLSSKTIVHTKSASDLLKEEYGVYNCVYIPIGIYKRTQIDKNKIIDFKNKINLLSKDKILLLFGNPYEGKGYEYMIEALPDIFKEHQDVKLIIAGGRPNSIKDSSYLSMLKGLVKKIGVEDNVIFMGYVSVEDLPCLFSIVDIVVFPYEYRFAGSGAIADVLGYSKPVIVTDIPTFDFLENNKTCIKINPDNMIDELSIAVCKLLEDEKLIQRLKINLNNLNLRNSIQNMSLIYRDLYESLK